MHMARMRKLAGRPMPPGPGATNEGAEEPRPASTATRRGQFEVNQGAVWEEVAFLSQASGQLSATQDAHEVYEKMMGVEKATELKRRKSNTMKKNHLESLVNE